VITGNARATRSQGRPNGHHIRACVQARTTAASRAGQASGGCHPHGGKIRHAATSHSRAIAAAPYSIGQPASAAVFTGRVNMREGKHVPRDSTWASKA